MCIICASKAGVRQPTADEFRNMFSRNPDGAGYMFLDSIGGKPLVHIRKGFMTFDSFMDSVNAHNFSDANSVVYHFRISTQAGISKTMCHPFPYCDTLDATEFTDVLTPVGFTHNGIIRITSDPTDKRYSDTAHFVAEYMPFLIGSVADLDDQYVLDRIDRLTNSKWAIMDYSGTISTVGHFINEDGLLFSNSSYAK